jgi:hypothetical protein
VRAQLQFIFKEDFWPTFVQRTIEQKKEDLKQLHRHDPGEARVRLLTHLHALEGKRSRLKELFIDGDLSKDEYRKG